MSLKITKLARKFRIILANSEDYTELLNDPVYYGSSWDPSEGKLQYEVTEEMDDIINDILNSVILIRREFNEILKEKGQRHKEGVRAIRILNDLDRVEEVLGDIDAFTVKHYRKGYEPRLEIRTVSQICEGIKLDLLRDSRDGEKTEYSYAIIPALNDILNNVDKLIELARNQSRLTSDNDLLVNQDDKDVDTIPPEEVHVDFQYDPSEDEDMEAFEIEPLPRYEPEPPSMESSDLDHDSWAKPGKTYHAR